MTSSIPHADRYFAPESSQRKAAQELYTAVADLPLICPHGHVDPRLFVDPDYTFGSPVELLLIPDHYIFRMLYSQGIALESLGISPLENAPQTAPRAEPSVEADHRAAWQRFADHFYLFQGTPTGVWLRDELTGVFGITEKLTSANAQSIYDQLADKLASPQFTPRQLFHDFNIEVLCTTDAATDTLDHHQVIRDSGWDGRILPTFRPDAVVNLDMPGWQANIAELSRVAGIDVGDYPSYRRALEQRRAFFKEMGATATDHAALTAFTGALSPRAADAIFQRARRGEATTEDARRFTGHMLMEMARMSVDDGLIMQLHVGSFRGHNDWLQARFGRDMGADIPTASEFTKNLHPLLQEVGNDPALTLILFNLDETTYSRELAPLAGHYPALRLGPPWWFFDSLNGIRRYFDQVVETAGIYNTAGFNDDTRAYPSIPARHDLWRRAAADWVGGLLVRDIVDEEDAHSMVHALAYDLAKTTYHLG